MRNLQGTAHTRPPRAHRTAGCCCLPRRRAVARATDRAATGHRRASAPAGAGYRHRCARQLGGRSQNARLRPGIVRATRYATSEGAAPCVPAQMAWRRTCTWVAILWCTRALGARVTLAAPLGLPRATLTRKMPRASPWATCTSTLPVRPRRAHSAYARAPSTTAALAGRTANPLAAMVASIVPARSIAAATGAGAAGVSRVVGPAGGWGWGRVCPRVVWARCGRLARGRGGARR